MQDRSNERMGTSFRNPFDDYNANVLEPGLIMQYWYSPFQTGALKGIDEHDFFSQKMPIILQGSRGSGKTTILKYFSFPVQNERAMVEGVHLKEQVLRDGGTGFYFRCDNSFIREFQSVFNLSYQDRWVSCFEHYYELFVVKSLLDFISLLSSQEDDICADEIVRQAMLGNLGEDMAFDSIEMLRNYINSEIQYINTYKNESLFTNEEFKPKHIWSLYDLSGRIIQSISQEVLDLNGITYLLLIDEFENLPHDLQKMFNTFIKFCRSSISMRVGRRSENIVTTETINDVEYLREQNDYKLVVLDQWKEIQAIKPYLLGIAQKRLDAFEGLKIRTDLISMIGDKEDLDAECQSVADENNKHLKAILSGNEILERDRKLMEIVVSIISYPENRIAEMLCALWVARCDNDVNYIEMAESARSAMIAYLQKGDHPLKKKFADDYNNKYRYALTVLLCLVYKKDKLYYGFNDLCYLSEGNARTFINLCKSILSDALFYEKKRFYETKTISYISQARAIKNYSISEFNSVFSIIQNGKSIRELVLSLGNVFLEFHKDKYVRYPETNQFIFVYDTLPEEEKRVIDTAVSWAIIKKRKDPQRLSASIAKEGDIYTINRIFSPVFNISYRTRGGVNVYFSSEEIHDMMSGQFKKNKLGATSSRKRSSPTKRLKPEKNKDQLSLFEQAGEKK